LNNILDTIKKGENELLKNTKLFCDGLLWYTCYETDKWMRNFPADVQESILHGCQIGIKKVQSAKFVLFETICYC